MAKKLSAKQMSDRIRQISIEIDALAAERATLFATMGDVVKTRYRAGKPSKPGVYHYSSKSCAVLGGALGYWDGKTWKPYKNWGDFTNRNSPVVWYGEGRDGKQPIQDSSI